MWQYQQPTGPKLDVHAKGILSLTSFPYEKGIIQDHNSEGYDSVDSEAFDPSYGCEVEDINTTPLPPPEMPDNTSDNDKWNLAQWNRREEEVIYWENQYLNKYGII